MGGRRKAKQRRGRYITTGLTYIEGVFRVKTLDFFISFSSPRVNPAALMQCEHRITFTSTVSIACLPRSRRMAGSDAVQGVARNARRCGFTAAEKYFVVAHDFSTSHHHSRSAVARRRLKGARDDAKLEEDVADDARRRCVCSKLKKRIHREIQCPRRGSNPRPLD